MWNIEHGNIFDRFVVLNHACMKYNIQDNGVKRLCGGGGGREVVSTRFDSIRFVRSFVFDVEQCLFIQDRNSRVTGVHITRRKRVNENSGERFTNLPSKLIDAQVESNSGCLLIASICGGGNDDSITTRIVTEGLEERAKKGEG